MATPAPPRFRRQFTTVSAPDPNAVLGSDVYIRSLESYAASRARAVQRIKLVPHEQGSYTAMRGELVLDMGPKELSPEDRAIVVQGRLRHELLHVLETNREVYGEFQQQLGEVARSQGQQMANRLHAIFNILEDGRIETLEAERSPGSYAYIQAMNRIDPRIQAESTVERDIRMPKPQGYTPTDASGRELEVDGDRVVIRAGTRVSVWGKTPYGPGPQMEAALMAESNPDFEPGELLPEVASALDEMRPVVQAAMRGNTADVVAAASATNAVMERHGILPEIAADQGRTQAQAPDGLKPATQAAQLPDNILDEDREGHDASEEARGQQAPKQLDPETLEKMLDGPLGEMLGKMLEHMPDLGGKVGAPSEEASKAAPRAGEDAAAPEASGSQPALGQDDEGRQSAPADDGRPQLSPLEESPEAEAAQPDRSPEPAPETTPEQSTADAAAGQAAEDVSADTSQAAEDPSAEASSASNGAGGSSTSGEPAGTTEPEGPQDATPANAFSGQQPQEPTSDVSGGPQASQEGSQSGESAQAGQAQPGGAGEGEAAPNRGPTGFEAPAAEPLDPDAPEPEQTGPTQASAGGEPSAPNPSAEAAPADVSPERADEISDATPDGDESSEAASGQGSQSSSLQGGSGGSGIPGEPVEPLDPIEVPEVDMDDMREKIREQLAAMGAPDLQAAREPATTMGGWVMPEGNAYQDQQTLGRIYGNAIPESRLAPIIARASMQGARIAKDLERVQREGPQADYYLRSGRADASAFPRVIAGSANVFQRERQPQEASVELLVVVDCSSSTQGYRPEMYEMALAFAFASRYTNIPITLVGFSGYSGYNDDRSPVQHFEFFNGKRAKNDLRAVKSIIADVGMGGTPLGPAVEFGHARLHESRKKAKLLTVITDGAPDDAYAVKEAIDAARADGIDVSSFAFGCSSELMDQMFGPGHWHEITDYSQPAAQMAQILKGLVARQILGHPTRQAPTPPPPPRPEPRYDDRSYDW